MRLPRKQRRAALGRRGGGKPQRPIWISTGRSRHYSSLVGKDRATGGQAHTVTIEFDTAPRIVEIPADLADAFGAHPATAAAWERLSHSGPALSNTSAEPIDRPARLLKVAAHVTERLNPIVVSEPRPIRLIEGEDEVTPSRTSRIVNDFDEPAQVIASNDAP